MKDRAALGMALAATVGLSMKGIFAKLAYVAGVSVTALVLWRMVASLPLFLAAERVMPKAEAGRASRRDTLACLAFGLLFLTATVSDFAAIGYLGASLSRIVLFTYPLIVVVLESAVQRRWPGRMQLTAFALAYTGLLIVLRPDRVALPEGFGTGIALSIYCAFAIASFYTFGNPLMRRVGAARFSTLTQTSATAGMIAYALLRWTGTVGEPVSLSVTGEGLLWLAAVVLIATVAPMLLQYEAMRRIGAGRASLIALLGPVFTVIVAWFVLDERLDAAQIGGFALVLTGLWLLEGRKR